MRPKAAVSMIAILILVFGAFVLTSGIAVGAEGKISPDIGADTDIRLILSTIAKDNGINLVIGDSVKGMVRISLKEVTPMEAIELILIANGFSIERVGNSLVAGKPEDIKKYLPKSSKVIDLQYASATELAQALSGMVAGDVEITADPRTKDS